MLDCNAVYDFFCFQFRFSHLHSNLAFYPVALSRFIEQIQIYSHNQTSVESHTHVILTSLSGKIARVILLFDRS
jgi:hypothetical protein